MKRARATMDARKGRVNCGSISGRRRQSSSGATSLRPISSSITCGGGSTRTCIARHNATRTAVLSGAATVCLSCMNLRIAMSGQKRAGAETTRWTCEASAPATDTGPYFTIADGTKHPASRYAPEYIPPLTRSKTRARNARHSAVSLRARFACQIRAGQRLRRRGHHRLHRAEVLVDRAHVDVPAFALGRMLAGQITHRRVIPLRVDRRRADYEFALERIDRNARIGHRPVAISQPIDMRAPQTTLLIVGVDVRLEPYFRIEIDVGQLVERAAANDVGSGCRFDNVHVPRFPGLRAGGRAAVIRASVLG